MKRLLLLLCLLAVPVASFGQNYVVSGMGDPSEQEALNLIRAELQALVSALPEHSAPDGWRFVLLNEDGWDKLGDVYKSGTRPIDDVSDGAITHYLTQITYLRQKRYQGRPAILRKHLLHELLHISDRLATESEIQLRTKQTLLLLRERTLSKSRRS